MSRRHLARLACLFAAFIFLPPMSMPASAQDWYPLIEGARWEYTGDLHDVVVTVQAPVERLGLEVWPVVYQVAPHDGLDFDFVYYTHIDEQGDVIRIGGSFVPDAGFWEFRPPWTFLRLPPAVGQSWEMGYDDQVWHADKKRTTVAWLAEEDIDTPAGTFHVVRCPYASVAAGVGVVRQQVPAVSEISFVDLVSYEVPVAVEAATWTDVKHMFR
jgi:hypothetical protein